jgi:hypothetical protein
MFFYHSNLSKIEFKDFDDVDQKLSEIGQFFDKITKNVNCFFLSLSQVRNTLFDFCRETGPLNLPGLAASGDFSLRILNLLSLFGECEE